MFQTTLKETITFTGKGLHSGNDVTVSIHPAYADSGIRFRRSDVKNTEYCRVTPYTVNSTQLATTITCDGLPISTIEHLMAALYGMGIDNALVDVSGQEVPILDGSAAPYVAMINKAGIRELPKKRKYIVFNQRIRLEQDGKWIEVIPSRFFKMTCHIKFDKHLPEQKAFYTLAPDTFERNLADSRTFGFQSDVEMMHSMGLAKGGSLDNAVVIAHDGSIMNPDGLRHEDEFVRHKILDMIGDISLIGYRIRGHVRAFRSGHQLNNQFARLLLESSDLYTITELQDSAYESTYTHLVLEPQGTV